MKARKPSSPPSSCVKRWRRPTAPSPWSRPRRSSPAASPPCWSAGASPSRHRPACRFTARRLAASCCSSRAGSATPATRSACSPCSSTTFARIGRSPDHLHRARQHRGARSPARPAPAFDAGGPRRPPRKPARRRRAPTARSSETRPRYRRAALSRPRRLLRRSHRRRRSRRSHRPPRRSHRRRNAGLGRQARRDGRANSSPSLLNSPTQWVASPPRSSPTSPKR